MVYLADEYIQFRIKKTGQIPFRCQTCQFCFPDQKTYDRHILKNHCQKFKRQYDEYIESLEDDDGDSDEEMDTSSDGNPSTSLNNSANNGHPITTGTTENEACSIASGER